jgi:DNA (cytosine-5)-methyltransferase 1
VRRLTAVDLFSGCGGLTLGLKRGGFRVLAAVEIEPNAAATYEKNHPEVVLCQEDIRNIPAKSLLDAFGLKPGELDLLAGCPPCQGFSAMKTLNGAVVQDEPGNELIFEYLRFVRVCRPKALMLENVPALFRDARFEKFRGALESLGYEVNADVLDAAAYGVPQRRRRLIIVAGLQSRIEFAPPARHARTVRDAFGLLSRKRAKTDSLHNLPERRSPKVLKLIQKIPPNGGSRKQAGKRFQLECHAKCDGFGDVYGRMSWDKVAPTITSGCFNPSKGRFIHPTKHRAITMREAALLQSFPVSYRFSLDGGKTAAALMIGNALPPEFIRRHAQQIAKHLLQTHM